MSYEDKDNNQTEALQSDIFLFKLKMDGTVKSESNMIDCS